MVGAILGDVLHGGIGALHHAGGQREVEILGGVVVFRRFAHAGQELARALVPPQRYVRLLEQCSGTGKKVLRHVLVHQERLQRVADTGTRDLAVEQQVLRNLQVGVLVYVEVADALVVLDDGDATRLVDEADEPFAAARDNEVDVLVQGQHFLHRRPVGGRNERDRRGRHALRL